MTIQTDAALDNAILRQHRAKSRQRFFLPVTAFDRAVFGW